MDIGTDKPRSNLIPDRYYTPPAKNPDKAIIHASLYEPTPPPQTVTFHKKASVPKKESCCLACLLVCCLCLAVKGEDSAHPDNPDSASPETITTTTEKS